MPKRVLTKTSDTAEATFTNAYSIEEVAQELSKTGYDVRQDITNGRIRAYRIEGEWRVFEQDLQDVKSGYQKPHWTQRS